MLERDKGPTRTYGFLIAIEIQDGVDLESVKLRLSDAVLWYEGTGKCEVESLGVITEYEKPKCSCYPWEGIHAVDCPLTVKGSDGPTAE